MALTRAFVPMAAALGLGALAGCTMMETSAGAAPGEVVAVADMPGHCSNAAAIRFGVAPEQLLVRQAVGTSNGYVLEGLLGTVAFSCFYAPDGRYISIATAADAAAAVQPG
ncbi:MAG: hypothetical protein AB7O56_03965 [Bauldia sp.]